MGIGVRRAFKAEREVDAVFCCDIGLDGAAVG